MGIFKKKKKQKDFARLFEIYSKAMSEVVQRRKEISPTILDGQRPEADDYGLSEANPICIRKQSMITYYLGRLCTKDGDIFTWTDDTDIIVTLHGITNVLEIKYTIYLNGKPYSDIFFVTDLGQADLLFPPAGLYFSDDDTDWDLEREALSKGVSAEQLRAFHKMEKENEVLRQKMKEENAKKEAELKEELDRENKEYKTRLEADTILIQKKYPDFNLESELTNQLFYKLTRLGFQTQYVYEYIHRHELLSKKIKKDFNQSPRDYSVDSFFNILCEIENKSKPAIIDVHSWTMYEIEKKASEIDVPVEAFIAFHDIEKETAEKQWKRHIESLRGWAEKAYETKTLYPEFDLSVEWQNQSFKQLIQIIDMPTAYEFLHFKEYYEKKSKNAYNNPPSFNRLCLQCGAELLSDSAFCHKCGKPIQENANAHHISDYESSKHNETQNETDVYKLAVLTVKAIDMLSDKHSNMIIADNDLTKCDSIIFCCFVIRAFCLFEAASREVAINFSEEYIDSIKGLLKQKFISLNSYVSKMFDNRAICYDKVFASKIEPEDKFKSILEEFEKIIKLDLINKAYTPVNVTSPLPILSIDLDVKIRNESNMLFNDLPTFISPYFERVKQNIS